MFAVAPASANTLAKLAGGHADNLLTAAALACRRPLILAPAMNAAMYEHPATQANLARLRERGAIVLEPGTGSLASLGEEGDRPPARAARAAGRDRARARRAAATLDGLKVLVTAGGTREPIDAVRYVGNRSCGRMGFALAEAAAAPRRRRHGDRRQRLAAAPRRHRLRRRHLRRRARGRRRAPLRATPTCC